MTGCYSQNFLRSFWCHIDMVSGACIIEHIMAVIYSFRNKLECLFLASVSSLIWCLGTNTLAYYGNRNYRVTGRLKKIAQILEIVAQRVAKPKNGTIHYPLLNSINANKKSYFHPKIFWPFKKWPKWRNFAQSGHPDCKLRLY